MLSLSWVDLTVMENVPFLGLVDCLYLSALNKLALSKITLRKGGYKQLFWVCAQKSTVDLPWSDWDLVSQMISSVVLEKQIISEILS